ncbi:hypothetical protein [Spiroplasma endosymbiont of Panorpa germanica]|uniref:hypothetical protein n=1 Tax=Spiroplasma endosymbiont of Panorpa germanica TaxID=3066314 RepID=UPI0030D15FF8
MNNKYIWAFQNKKVKTIYIVSMIQAIFLILISITFLGKPYLFQVNSAIEATFLFLNLLLFCLMPLGLAICLIIFISNLKKINVKDQFLEDMDANLKEELPITSTRASSTLTAIIFTSVISIIFIIIWFLQLLVIDTYFQSNDYYNANVVLWGANILKNSDISIAIKILINFMTILPFLILPILIISISSKVLLEIKKDPFEVFKSDFIKTNKKVMSNEDIINKSNIQKTSGEEKSDYPNSNNTKISDFKNFNQRMADEKNHWDDLTKVDGIDVNLGKDIVEMESVDLTLKKSCEKFFKKAIQVFEKGENTNNDMYKKFRVTYSALLDNSLDHKLDQVEKSIEDYINFTSESDLKFVGKIEDLMKNNPGFFVDFSDILITLISKFKTAIKNWEILEAEVAIEQIFAIALNYQNLIAKVGFCIKHRLVNNFDSIEKDNNLITKLDFARDNKKFSSYKLICEEAIILMSPIKEKLKKFIGDLS